MTLVSIFFVTQGFACTCPFPGSIAEEFSKSSLIIEGKVVNTFIKEVSDESGQNKHRIEVIKMAILNRYKGIVSADTVEISNSLGSCGYRFKRGRRYIVYANMNDDNGRYGTSNCTRNQTKKFIGVWSKYSAEKKELSRLGGTETAAN